MHKILKRKITDIKELKINGKEPEILAKKVQVSNKLIREHKQKLGIK
jgi:hypothetical protein